MTQPPQQEAPPGGMTACLAEQRTGLPGPSAKSRRAVTAPVPRREARSGRSIHRLFAEQAEAVPLFTAMVHAGKELRYRELNAQANRIARLLADRGAGRGQFVALSAEPSPELLAGLLGILKSGAACLLDESGTLTGGRSIPGFTGAAVGLAAPGRKEALSRGRAAGGTSWLALDDGLLTEGEAPEAVPAVSADDEALVVCRPTPLGTRVTRLTHGTLAEACCREISAAGITSSDSAAWLPGCGSAAFVRSALPFLLAGADVHLLGGELADNPSALHRSLGGMSAAFLPEEACAPLLAQGRLSLRLLYAGGPSWKRVELPAAGRTDEAGHTGCGRPASGTAAQPDVHAE
ncbi:AMP-binding protein [Paenibacillus mucilaginosus]|uniref:Lichenysin synthetase B n=1 Tax=Paenibacillus mucilaginosus (strain KNP414) TaxID=1036673 RepID=F8FFA7_PAEMK|nr:AMP-binding protein [Paenibacillus mucilaginosus]AEI41825.1 lichenysin synthetase B [Paenibacillus mucilaginosus KNP414]MCG7214506.1 AMP-binding protein [Paenibacillus mucilaginosus]WDM30787.1 AMP-binding protein [Paenibacillus mucilaginosus]